MTKLNPPENPGWRIQLAIHRAVRRDTTRLATALANDDEAPVEAVRAYWAVTATHLHHHHVLEDTVFWPLMAERLGDRVEGLLARNASEHQIMASAMGDFDASLGTMTTDPALAREALGRMHAAIESHLAHEEADVLPLIPEAFTMDDLAYFRAEDAKTNEASMFLPWMLDDAPDEDLAFFTANMPAPVRQSLESIWMLQRRELVDALLRADPVASAS